LDLARMQAGHIQLELEDVELEPYVNRIIRKFQTLAKDKDVQLNTVLDTKTDKFHFDPDKIEQVLTNLLDNAIRHIQNSGSITVTVKSIGPELLFEVSDNGPGILEEDLPFLFERFYKGDKSRTRGRSGTGLGLAIARNIIEAHRGNISVRSKLGQGTTFSFFIPRNNDML